MSVVKAADIQDLDGVTYVSGSKSLLASDTANADASLDFPSIFDSTKYDSYEIEFTNATVATDNVNIRLQVTDDNGSTYLTTSYRYSRLFAYAPSTYSGDGGESEICLYLLPVSLGNAADENASGFLRLYGMHGTDQVHCVGMSTFETNAGNMGFVTHGGRREITTALTGFRILAGAGNLAGGDYRIYGIRQ